MSVEREAKQLSESIHSSIGSDKPREGENSSDAGDIPPANDRGDVHSDGPESLSLSEPALHVGVQNQARKEGPLKMKRVFGISREKRENDPAHNILPDDYEKRYLPDEFGQEMGPNARVWRVYLDEAELNDRDMVEGWKDGIDVLLVFAGLFSAVVTTFVTQTSQKLDQDFGQVSASLLTELIAIQRASATGSSLEDVHRSELTLESPPKYTWNDTWVNGLWFTSLMLSLITALFAVLIKQWIQHYVSFISGTPLQRARIHQFRYRGLERWNVRTMIGILPVLLYAALFLFILGLAIFLQGLNVEIASIVGALGGITLVLYLVSNGLPLFYPQCPYRTPLAEPINATLAAFVYGYRKLIYPLSHSAIDLLHSTLTKVVTSDHSPGRIHQLGDWCEKNLHTEPPKYEMMTLKFSESQGAEKEQDQVIRGIMEWLLTVSSNPSVKPIALQSISGLPAEYSHINELLGADSLVRSELMREHERAWTGAQSFGSEPAVLAASSAFYGVERIIRACMMIPGGEVWASVRMSPWAPDDDDWETFYEKAHNLDPQPSASFWQATATYRLADSYGIYSWETLRMTFSYPFVATVAEKYPLVRKAWSNAFASLLKSEDILPKDRGVDKADLWEIYEEIRPLFRAFLSTENHPQTEVALLLLLYHVLPHDIVQQCCGNTYEEFCVTHPASQLDTLKMMLCQTLLTVVEDQWTVDNEQDTGADIRRRPLDGRDIVEDTCSWLSKFIQPYYTYDHDLRLGDLALALANQLHSLVSHEYFTKSFWSPHICERLFIAYFNTSSHPQINSAKPLLYHKHFHFLPTSWESERADRFWQCLFESGSNPSLIGFISQIVVTLDESSTNNSFVIKNTFECFLGLHSTKYYLSEGEFSSGSPVWPCHMQPVVRWMLDWVINHAGDQNAHPPVETFANKLLERPGFLSFICSSFLIDRKWPISSDSLVFGKESCILGRLAEYHKDKPGAIEAWRDLLSWVWMESSYIRLFQYVPESFTRADFDKYGKMADFVDEIATIFQLNGQDRLGVKRFEEACITELLRKREQKNANTFESPTRDPPEDGGSTDLPDRSLSAGLLIPKPQVSISKRVLSYIAGWNSFVTKRDVEEDVEMQHRDG